MSTERPVPESGGPRRNPQVESEHVEVGRATIDVSQATIVQSPQSRRQALYLAYALGVLFLFVIVIGAANLLFTTGQVHSLRQTQAQSGRNSAALAQANAKLQKQIIADCGFNRDLAGLPVTPVNGGHPSELGVKIVLDARASWYGHACPGTLPLLDPTIRAGAAFYHLPIPQPPPGR